MRKLATLALATISSVALAQSPLSTLNGQALANNGGNVGGGLYFNLTVNTKITITGLSYFVGTATGLGAMSSVDIYLGPATYVGNVTDPSLWTHVGSTTPQSVPGQAYTLVQNSPVSPVAAAPSVTLCPGSYGIALLSVGASHGYTNPIGCTSNTIPGSCSNSTFQNTELRLDAGAAQNAFLAGGLFQPRIFTGEIHYNVDPTATCLTFAAREEYGEGCYEGYTSWGQLFPNPNQIGYANTSVRMAYNTSGNFYDLVGGTTPPTPVTSAPLGHAADGDILIDATTNPAFASAPILYASASGLAIANAVYMNADGFLTMDVASNVTGGPGATQTAVDNWLMSPGTTFGNWKNWDPSAGGSTHYDFDTNASEHLFTWQGVADNGGSTTFQIAIDGAGNIEYRWGAVAQTGGGGAPVIVGFTTGINAVDPGVIRTDFQAALPFSTAASDTSPLQLSAAANPVINTTVDLVTTNESTAPGVGVCFVTSVSIPGGFPLDPIGAPGCFAHVDINAGSGNVIDNIPLNGMTVPLPVPNQTNLVGLNLYCQSAWLDASANAFGVITSNGLRLAIGSF